MGILRALAAHKVVTAIVAATALGVGGTGVVIVSQPNCTNLRGCLSDVGLPNAPSPPACAPPGSNPKFIAIFLQGIASYVLARSDQLPGTDEIAVKAPPSKVSAPGPNPVPTPPGFHGYGGNETAVPAVASFNAATTSYCATTPDETPQSNGELPPNNKNIVLRSMADGWLNYSYSNNGLGTLEAPDPSTVLANDPENIFNQLANLGGMVLPFSYTGATMSGTAADPTFTLNAYDGRDVAINSPMLVEPPALNSELVSIHKVFPNTPIILIGHSNGGLIAEQWWLRYGVPQPASHNCPASGPVCGYHGVVHIWSLDSPINGVANAGLLNGVTCSTLIALFAECDSFVSTSVASDYANLWGATEDNPPDPEDGADHIESEDKADGGMYTAEGTYGDPLYDAGDIPDGAGDGILSQIMLSDHCMSEAGQPGLASAPECQPEPYTLISPCDGTYLNTPSSPQSPADVANGLNDGPPLFGMPGDVYIHSEAKDCPGTVNVIVNFIASYTPPAIPPANALAAWNATDNGCATTMAASLRNVASLLPSSDATQIADLNQFAGLPLSELGEGTQQQQTEGQADLNALNTFFGTSRTLTTFTGACTTTPPTTPAPVTTPTTTAPTTPPNGNGLLTPGYGSPADAVDGFYQSELAGNWAAVCSYVTPSAQTLCLAGTSGQAAATGTANVGTMVIGPDNTEALVSVTGNICAPSSPCAPNSDPGTGMPNGPSEFASDYAAAVANTTGSATVLSPMPCTLIGGKWYVDFG